MKSQITDIFAGKLAKTVISKVAEAVHLSFVFDRKSLKIPVAAFAASAKTLDFTADLENDFEKYPQNTHILPETSHNLPTFYPQLPANYPQFTRNFPQITRILPETTRHDVSDFCM